MNIYLLPNTLSDITSGSFHRTANLGFVDLILSVKSPKAAAQELPTYAFRF